MEQGQFTHIVHSTLCQRLMDRPPWRWTSRARCRSRRARSQPCTCGRVSGRRTCSADCSTCPFGDEICSTVVSTALFRIHKRESSQSFTWDSSLSLRDWGSSRAARDSSYLILWMWSSRRHRIRQTLSRPEEYDVQWVWDDSNCKWKMGYLLLDTVRI